MTQQRHEAFGAALSTALTHYLEVTLIPSILEVAVSRALSPGYR